MSLIDLRQFQESHPAFRELIKILKGTYAELERYDKATKQQRGSNDLAKKYRISCKEVAQQFANAGIIGFDTKTELVMGIVSETNALGEYHVAQNKLCLNENHPYFWHLEAKQRVLDSITLNAAVEVMAHTVSKGNRDTFLKTRSQIYSKLKPDFRISEAQSAPLFPNVLYPLATIRDRLDMTAAEINYLFSGGLLTKLEGDRVKGEEAARYIKSTKGLKPLYTLLLENFDNPEGKLSTMEGIFERIGNEKLAPMIFNLGRGANCYFVEPVCEGVLVEAMTDLPRHGSGDAFYAKAFSRVKPETISSLLHGVTVSEVSQVLNACEKLGNPLPGIDGKVKLCDFVVGLQLSRNQTYAPAR